MLFYEYVDLAQISTIDIVLQLYCQHDDFIAFKHYSVDRTTRKVEVNLLSLPNELLAKIVTGLLKQSKEKQLVAGIVKTCRRLNNIAVPLIWADIRFEVAGRLRVFSRAMFNTQFPTYIRTLTLDFDISKPRYDDPKTVTLRGFGRMLRATNRLQTLSINITPVNDSRQSWARGLHNQPMVAKQVLTNLLDAIPSSVTALDLDAMQCGLWHNGRRSCAVFCRNLSALLQQLQHLRIHQWLCCPKIWDFPTLTAPSLKSLIIQMNEDNSVDPDDRSTFYYQGPAATRARKAYERGAFPVLCKFLIIGPHNSIPANDFNHYDNAKTFHSVRKMDITRNKTTVIPWDEFRMGKWWARLPSTDHFEGDGCFEDEFELENSGKLFWQCIEDETWIETANGTRRPNTTKTGLGPRTCDPDSAWSWFKPFSDEEKYYNRRANLRSTNLLWKDEYRAGRKLLFPRVTQGFEDDKPLKKERYLSRSESDRDLDSDSDSDSE